MALIKISEPGTSQTNEGKNEVVVGIDLGTTNSLVAIVINETVKFFADENGRDIHPSTVDFGGKKISSIKRFMGVGFTEVEGVKVAPSEVSAEILKHLKNLAEKSLNTEIRKAVITVPAYFDETAKNATKLAANLAGLEVLRLVNEPTAAALAYGLDNKVEGTYCVFDLGGGTFDVSILKMQKGVFKVLGVAGDNQLGGDDFDEAIAKHLGVNRSEARKIKEEQKIDQEVFEKLISEKIGKTFSLTQNLIDDLDLSTEEIKGVILVGGSTRIPLIKRKLAEIFGEEKILDQLDPDRIVAAGAAWQAHNLSGKSDNLLLDVVPLSLGIEMMGGIVDKVVHRNSTIPIALAKEFTTYADNQTGMKLHVVQGERELAKDCRSLAEFEIKGIPAMKAGLARITVTFKVDADGLLTVSAEEKTTQTKQEIVVKPSYGLSENEVKEMLLDSLKNSQSDIHSRLLAQAVVEAKKDSEIIKKDLKNSPNLVSENERILITEKLDLLDKLLTEQTSREEILEAQKELGKATENLILQKVNLILQEKLAGTKIN